MKRSQKNRRKIMKKVLQLMIAALLIPMFAMAQNSEWQFQNTIPADSSVASSHGIAFDGAGNIWHGPYYPRTVEDQPRNYIYCHDTSGELCEGIEPIYQVAAGDSMLKFNRITGMTSDQNGDILVAVHGYRPAAGGEVWSKAYIIRIDHLTGDPLGIADVTDMRDDNNSHAFHISADKYGDIYYATVFPGQPIRVMDADFNPILNVTDNRAGFARDIAVFTDDNDITRVYVPSNEATPVVAGEDTVFVGGRIAIYEGDTFDGFNVLDTLSIIGMDPGAIAVCPQTEVVYAPASGSGGSPEGDPTRWQALTVYGLNIIGEGNYEVVDSLMWEFGEGDPYNPVYRALDVSPDGLGLAMGSFTTTPPGVLFYSRNELPGVSAEEFITDVPEGYALSQNYPNPFNPSTLIRFEIGEPGLTSLKVFDLLGQEVATLVNDKLQAGSHEVNFDAVDLASGLYIYRLEANGHQLSRKMMFVK